MAMSKGGVLRLLVGLFLATAIAGATAHEIIDSDIRTVCAPLLQV
jgi:hypothetical protein